MDIARLLLGRRLPNRDAPARKISTWEAVPALGLDALGSSAYGPEAALAILAPLGAVAAGRWLGVVMTSVIVLLAILFVSYLQTIRAYPHSGGAYLVAKQNLGTLPSLLAAAALMIDYVLNVAVGISAGVGALVSLVPSLHAHALSLCLGVLALITLINLRGTPESGRAFALPTYAFVASFLAIAALGAARTLAAGGHPAALVPPPAAAAAQAAGGVGLWLLLRAFASGCAAMTGVEAVSNGMGAFRDPSVRYGSRTLAIIIVALALLLAGVAVLVPAYGVVAMDQSRAGYRSVLAQVAGAVVGDGVFYDIALCALVGVLTLSANTSFVAFPRLCRGVAEDGFLPAVFAVAGRRLVMTVGVLYLAGTAGLLLLVFDGITDRLIPLFAVGAFLGFSLSQAAMVVHWRRAARHADSRAERARAHLRGGINATGAIATTLALAVIAIGKFTEGAWITLLAIPAMIALLLAVYSYHREVARLGRAPGPLDFADARPPLVLVAMEQWNRLTANALGVALSLSPDVVAVHLTQLAGPAADEHLRGLCEHWQADVEDPARAAQRRAPQLRIVNAPYRTMYQPLLELVGELEQREPGRRVAVLIPELVKQRWYQQVLHGRRAQRLRRRLLRKGGVRLTVISVPWYLEAPGEGGAPAPGPADA